MIYKVIGLMSGSSLDGLDIAYIHLEEIRGKWTYELVASECAAYPHEWVTQLKFAAQKPVADFLRMHTAYGHFTGTLVNAFIEKNDLHHKIDFIASHGHTVFHDPEHRTTFQLGDGASIAAETGFPVISDLRNMDVALGGQGAPIVPVGDRLLYNDYDYLLNIGGIANITVMRGDDTFAFDVCPANQVLNLLAQRSNQDYDDGGRLAAKGQLLNGPLGELNSNLYYAHNAPKSLSNEMALEISFPPLMDSPHAVPDMLHTFVQHIAEQVAEAVSKYPAGKPMAEMLITGGGALNTFLVERIKAALDGSNVAVTIPDEETIQFKEAIVMALIGTLRWREEVNVWNSVTGADKSSINGALWMV